MAENGRRPSTGLFIEFVNGNYGVRPNQKSEPVYSIVAFHKVFIEEADLTEYRPAIKLVGSWEEWCRIKKESDLFSSFIDKWKEELEQKFLSEAQQKIIDLLDDDSSSIRFSAAKWLAEKSWDKKSRGRPSKSQVENEQKRLAKASQVTEEEFTRVSSFMGSEGVQ